MIKVDLSLAIAIYISFCLILVICRWIFYNWYGDKELVHRIEFFNQCPFCTYIFFTFSKKDFTVCPRCKSYVSTEINGGKPLDKPSGQEKDRGAKN